MVGYRERAGNGWRVESLLLALEQRETRGPWWVWVVDIFYLTYMVFKSFRLQSQYLKYR